MCIKCLSKIATIVALCIVMAFVSLIPFECQAQEGLSEKDPSAELTRNFSPTYKEFSPKDTSRPASIRYPEFKGQKLIFFDDFNDNRHGWPYWTSGYDSIMRTCIGHADRKICKGKRGFYVNGFTNMVAGKKVIFGFTPEENLKYSNNIPIPLMKNYVVTLNPLSIKQVDKLPSPYYEGFNEHTTRIHNNFNGKSFVIETEITASAGSWGLLFGNVLNMEPHFYFKVNTDGNYEFKTVYPHNKEKPPTIASGSLQCNSTDVKNLSIHFKDNNKGGFHLEFVVNDKLVGNASISRINFETLDIGYRLDHNSIDGNNILICENLKVTETQLKTLIDPTLSIVGEWKGKLLRNNVPLYNVSLQIKELKNNYLSGKITFEHTKYKDVSIVKYFKANKNNQVINFEDLRVSPIGIHNEINEYSLLQMGHLEIIDPDSMVMNSFCANNLHLFGEIAEDLMINSDDIYLSRKDRIQSKKSGLEQIFANKENFSFEISDIYFEPDKAEILDNVLSRESLDQLSRELHRYLLKNPGKIILIHGHTDLGVEQILSLTRTFTVKNELVKRGVNANIFCIGHGRSQRISVVRGDPRNRRVEVEIIAVDSIAMENESLHVKEGGSIFLIKDLPSVYTIQTEFRLTAGKQYVIFENQTGSIYRWEIPNIAGGKRQSLKIIKRFKNESDGVVLEFWLDEVNVLTQSIHNYSRFGFEVDEGKLILDNLNIFAPE